MNRRMRILSATTLTAVVLWAEAGRTQDQATRPLLYVVGTSHLPGDTDTHAFLYSGGVMQDLNESLPPGSGWVLGTAYGINDRGQITGYGTYGGELRAFRLSPAVPVDTTAPVITSLSASPSVLDSPNHRMVPVAVTAAATDDSGVAPTCVLTDAASSEPDNGLGDGDTAGDIVRVSALTVQLRAERSAHGSGRVYSLTVMCTDEAGNAASGVTTVLVPKGGDDAATVAKIPGKKR